MSSLHCCRVCLGAEVSEAMEKAFAVVLAGRKMRPERFELSTFWRQKMPELELLEKACPEARRFREEKHGPHRLVVRMSRCGRGNLGLNSSVGILEQAWNCLAKAGCITSARVWPWGT